MGRIAFGFFNPNHAAAMICAVMPLCWTWRRARLVGWVLSAALIVALAATQSRTGLLVAGAEAVAWWWMRGMSGDAGTRRPAP